MQNLIDELVHSYYWYDDLNCAITTLKTLAEIFDVEIQPQVIDAAIGMHGAGGFQAQCGLVEGSLMFIGILGCQKNIEKGKIVELCYNFAQGFEQRFGSLQCKELRPQGFNQDDPPHLCEERTSAAIIFSAEFISSNF